MLRGRLQKIVKVKDVKEHSKLFTKLSEEISNSIIILDSSFPIEKYTCIPYVFDLVDEPNCKEISQLGVGRVFPSPKFVEFLINRKYLKEIKHKNAQVGDIVLYSDLEYRI